MNEKPQLTLETITPQLAEEWLEKYNFNNRPLNNRHVLELVKEMEAGRWQLNGDTIRFSNDRLIDGQHRLAAIVKAQVTIQSVVVRGLSDFVFATIDEGKKRSGGDTFATIDEDYPTRLSAALGIIARYFDGKMMFGGTIYSNGELLEILKKHPEARQSIRKQYQGRTLVPHSIIDACHYLFSRKDPQMADLFIDKLITGIGLEQGSPILRLRERLVANSLQPAKLPKIHILALSIKAWNFTRQGATVKVLKFSPDETFPKIL